MVNKKVERWLKTGGLELLMSIGIEKGINVLDFGCGSGYFSIMISKVVGSSGKVYALDKSSKSLKNVERLAQKEGLKNIEIIKTEGGNEIPLGDNIVDFVLLYDVLHYVEDREEIYEECHRILKPDGILSIHPTHYNPGFVRKILNKGIKKDLDGIIEEVRESGFVLEKKLRCNVLHYKSLEESTILNFKVR
ncbi:MAG: class I SAM-dependent methyltransferase [Candidatus Aenigmatarchaeota archaeon]